VRLIVEPPTQQTIRHRQLAPGTINLRLGAVRRLAYEAADCGLLSADLAAGIRRVKGVKKLGIRLGNRLTAEQGHALWQAPDRQRLKGKRDRALLVDRPEISEDLVPGVGATLTDPLSFGIVPRNGRQERSQMA
jgi:hypothetical protein